MSTIAPNMNTQVIDSILGGSYDAQLDAISNSIEQRRSTLTQRNVANIKPGDTVHFSDKIRPKYLVGRPATVVRVSLTTIVVSCPSNPDYGRYSGHVEVRCPLSLISF